MIVESLFNNQDLMEPNIWANSFLVRRASWIFVSRVHVRWTIQAAECVRDS